MGYIFNENDGKYIQGVPEDTEILPSSPGMRQFRTEKKV